MPGPNRTIGGVFLLGIGTFVIGVILMLPFRRVAPAFFAGRTLDARTRSLLRDEEPSTDIPRLTTEAVIAPLRQRIRYRPARNATDSLDSQGPMGQYR